MRDRYDSYRKPPPNKQLKKKATQKKYNEVYERTSIPEMITRGLHTYPSPSRAVFEGPQLCTVDGRTITMPDSKSAENV